MAGFKLATVEVSRERLEGLMFFRAVLVTLFLGSAVAVDVEALSALSNFKNAVILGLIVATYGLTIVYAFAIRRTTNYARLGIVQVFLDLVITTALVAVTNAVDSLFTFLFLITIINSAVVLGRRAAVFSAIFTTFAFGALAIYELNQPSGANLSTAALVYRITLNSAGAFVIAILSGYLAERLSEATAALEEREVNLAELRALNADILASLSSGLITVDASGEIIFFNRAAEELTGYPKEEVLNEPLDKIFPRLSARELSDEVRRRESQFVRKDGAKLQLGFSISPLRDGTGSTEGLIVIFQDLTEIRELEEQMRRSERLAAIGELAAGIAHEIRNPLASISGSVEMLRDVNDDEDPERKALLGIVMREVDRLDQLISDFLDYSRPRPLELEPTDVAQSVTEVVRLFRNGEPDASIQINQPADDIVVNIDAEAFRQVVWNLLKNGSEACREAGRSAVLHIDMAQDDDSIIISFEDDGAGLDKAAAEHIFEPFFTTKEKGTGLGLATIFRIIEEHDAVIRHMAPRELRGARFELEFSSVSPHALSRADAS